MLPHPNRRCRLAHCQLFLTVACCAVVFLLLTYAAPANAQTGLSAPSSLLLAQRWPEYEFVAPQVIERGPGSYLSWWKLLLLWLTFLFWVWTTDWTSRDCQRHGFSYPLWNSLAFFPFLVALFLGGLTIPLYAVGLPVTLLAVLVPLLVYIYVRNQKLEMHERVLTKDHLRFVFAELAGKAGLKVSAEAKAAYEKGAPVTFLPKGNDDEQQNQANLINARQSSGFLPAKEMILSAVDHRADKLMIDYSQEGVAVRYQVDGVWHEGDAQDEQEGEELLAVLKTISDLNPEERRARQQSRFGADINGVGFDCGLVSQGTKTGERVMINIGGSKTVFRTLEELGMREKMIERYKDVMLSNEGVLVLSAMPANGLSSTLNVSLRSTDRLLRDFVSVEDKYNRLEEVENVDPTVYDSRDGKTPFDVLPALIRKQPDVLIVPELPNAETAEILFDTAIEDHLIFTTIRAKEAVEALLRVLLLKVPANKFAPVVVAVLNQRLVRKLCESCKEAYTPAPALLKKLGIPEGRIEELYRHPEEPEEVCPDCHGIGYLGRTAIFELLVVDDKMREALTKQPKLDVLRKVARQSGHRTLQEEGIAAVVRGVTSLPELMRVLKQ